MGSSLPRGQNVESIFVSKAEHDSLLVTAKRYGQSTRTSIVYPIRDPILNVDLYVACLQRHLLEGGVSQETISVRRDAS